MTAIRGYNASLLITSQPSVNLPSNMSLQDTGDHQTFVVSSANASYRYWDRLASFTFQTSGDGATWANATPSTIQMVGGKIMFPSAVTGATPSARVTSGKYFPYAVLANITQWSFDGQRNFADATAMSGGINGGGGNPAKIFVPLQIEGTFSVTKFWVPETSESYVAYLTAGTPLILSGVEETGNRYEGYCYDKKLSLKVDNAKLNEHTLEFQLDGNFYLI